MLWMLVIFILSSLSTVPKAPSLSAEITAIAGHLVAYAVLSILIFFGLGTAFRDVSRRAFWAFVLSVLYGVSDEIHQSFVAGRDASVFDVMADATGAILGLLALYLISRIRNQLPDRPHGAGGSAL